MKPINEADLEQLSAYIDGELSDTERRFFQKRLSNDAELRACCERIWIASTVMKSQPLQIMTQNSAEIICSQCDDKPGRFATPMRFVASLGALAIVAGIGFQFMKTTEPTQLLTQTTAPATRSMPVSVAQTQSPEQINQISQNVPDAPSASAKPNSKVTSLASMNTGQSVAMSDPSQFELNENTRSKSWPRSSQSMDDYLVRHNQLVDANSSNGLISYAQILTDEQPASQEQGDK